MYGKRFNRNTSSDNCGLRKIEVSQNTDALFDNTTERAKQGRQSGTHRRGRLQRVTAEGQLLPFERGARQNSPVCLPRPESNVKVTG
jgi:hypothetical protein